MQEFQCSECGYRKWERQSLDVMMEMPMYGGFGVTGMMPVTNTMNWMEDSICPNCGKASSWRPIDKE